LRVITASCLSLFKDLPANDRARGVRREQLG
jgi:hypothetical protein